MVAHRVVSAGGGAMNSIYQDYLDGYASPEQAMAALLNDLGEVEDEIKTAETQRQAIRDAIGMIVAREGAMTVGDRRAAITAPSVVISYDRAAIDDLALRLAATHPDIAAELAQCRKQTERVGSLRVEKVRK
jgi:uncharacterized protein involved in exopolysaccharide biosynthesis